VITADATKKQVGLWDGSTENKTVVRAVPADLVSRGLAFDDGLLMVLYGAKALAVAVREVFGAKTSHVALGRCLPDLRVEPRGAGRAHVSIVSGSVVRRRRAASALPWGGSGHRRR
jgi:hypothetical protein